MSLYQSTENIRVIETHKLVSFKLPHGLVITELMNIVFGIKHLSDEHEDASGVDR